jgi:hypothetical protein
MNKSGKIVGPSEMTVVNCDGELDTLPVKMELDEMEHTVDRIFVKALNSMEDILDQKPVMLKNRRGEEVEWKADPTKVKAFTALINFQKLNELRKENLGLTKKPKFTVSDPRYNLNRGKEIGTTA